MWGLEKRLLESSNRLELCNYDVECVDDIDHDLG